MSFCNWRSFYSEHMGMLPIDLSTNSTCSNYLLSVCTILLQVVIGSNVCCMKGAAKSVLQLVGDGRLEWCAVKARNIQTFGLNYQV